MAIRRVAEDGMSGIDMDLDVVQLTKGTTWIDDEEEFEQHPALFGYPSDVIAAVAASAARLEALVRDRIAPFDEATPFRWLSLLSDLDHTATPDSPKGADPARDTWAVLGESISDAAHPATRKGAHPKG